MKALVSALIAGGLLCACLGTHGSGLSQTGAAGSGEEAFTELATLAASELFGVGSPVILPTAQETLNRLADMLKRGGYSSIVVECHTDTRGNSQKNHELSVRRAEAVREYFVARGVPRKSIRAVGLGGAQPIANNATREGRERNRRIVIRVSRERIGSPPEVSLKEAAPPLSGVERPAAATPAEAAAW